jgi:hypothetical protein
VSRGVFQVLPAPDLPRREPARGKVDEATARAQADPGQLYAWVQPLKDPGSGRRTVRSRLWVCRKGQKPTETVFSLETRTAGALDVAQAINRGSGLPR